MIKMKKTMIALALLTVAGFASAQTKGQPHTGSRPEQFRNMTPAERASVEAQRMTKRLGLSAEQKQSWQLAATERLNANRPIREKLQTTTAPEEREKLKSEMRQNKLTFEKKIDSFLSPDQKRKLSEQKQKRKDHQGGGMHKGNPNKG
jgi:hypothetical protein